MRKEAVEARRKWHQLFRKKGKKGKKGKEGITIAKYRPRDLIDVNEHPGATGVELDALALVAFGFRDLAEHEQLCAELAAEAALLGKES